MRIARPPHAAVRATTIAVVARVVLLVFDSMGDLAHMGRRRAGNHVLPR